MKDLKSRLDAVVKSWADRIAAASPGLERMCVRLDCMLAVLDEYGAAMSEIGLKKPQNR